MASVISTGLLFYKNMHIGSQSSENGLVVIKIFVFLKKWADCELKWFYIVCFAFN